MSARYNSKNELTVVWTGSTGTVTNAVYIRRFDSNMAAEGKEWKVNETPLTNPWCVGLSIGANDESIVSWDSGTNIYARLLDPGGSPVGHEFRINQFADGKHSMGWEACLHTTILENGNLVAAWGGLGASGSGVYLTVFTFITNNPNMTISDLNSR